MIPDSSSVLPLHACSTSHALYVVLPCFQQHLAPSEPVTSHNLFGHGPCSNLLWADDSTQLKSRASCCCRGALRLSPHKGRHAVQLWVGRGPNQELRAPFTRLHGGLQEAMRSGQPQPAASALVDSRWGTWARIAAGGATTSSGFGARWRLIRAVHFTISVFVPFKGRAARYQPGVAPPRGWPRRWAGGGLACVCEPAAMPVSMPPAPAADPSCRRRRHAACGHVWATTEG